MRTSHVAATQTTTTRTAARVQAPAVIQRQISLEYGMPKDGGSACGGGCPGCALAPLQPALLVGPSNDPLEREADRVADQIAAGGAVDRWPSRVDLSVQRCGSVPPETCPCHADEHTDTTLAPAIVHDACRSPGAPLEGGIRRMMESGFGQDFGDVRVHAQPGAAEA